MNDGGEFLANNQFGFAVVVASAGMEGDTQKDLVLTEARAVVVREYLVENFGFDDSQLKTLGMGKQTDTGTGANWGTVQIFIYPTGTEVPPSKQTQAGIASKTSSDRPGPASAGATSKPQETRGVVYSNSSITISGFDPSRRGGPQVPLRSR